MRITTNASNRKDIVKAMEAVLNLKAKYLGPPSFEYEIGNFRIDKEGTVVTDSEEEGAVMEQELINRGLIATENEEPGLSIEFPLEGFTAESMKNLIYMIHSKQYLLERSVGKQVLKVSDRLVERLEAEENGTLEKVLQTVSEEETAGLEFTQDRICFCGFPLDEEVSNVYTELVSHMIKAAKELKKVNPLETKEENEKYYMRIWLVRIGFGGAEGKEVRKVLLSKLKGHTAFRTEADKEKWIAKNGKKTASSAE